MPTATVAALRQPVGLIWGEAHGLQWERPRLLAAAFRDLQSSSTGPPRAVPTEGRWKLRNT